MTEGFEWTAEDVYAAQTMCPYETVALGFSKFCSLFTYEEWQGFGYSLDLVFSGESGFHSPAGVSAPHVTLYDTFFSLNQGID